MKYANPQLCPDCDRNTTMDSTCEHCGFDFRTPAASTLWKALVSADQWLEKARLETAERRSDAPNHTAAPVAPQPTENPSNGQEMAPQNPYQPYPAPVYAQTAPSPSMSVGTIILMLGCLAGIVAGLLLSALFIGKYALPLVAVGAGTLAYLTHTKKLRGTTETLIVTGLTFWSLFVGLGDGSGWLSLMLWAVLSLIPAFVLSTFVSLNDLPYRAQDWVSLLWTSTIGLAVVGLITENLSEKAPETVFVPLALGTLICGLIPLAYIGVGNRLGFLLNGLLWVTAAGFTVIAAYYDLVADNDVLFRGFGLTVTSLVLLAVSAVPRLQRIGNFLVPLALINLVMVPTVVLASNDNKYAPLVGLLVGALALLPVGKFSLNGTGNGMAFQGLRNTGLIVGSVSVLAGASYWLSQFVSTTDKWGGHNWPGMAHNYKFNEAADTFSVWWWVPLAALLSFAVVYGVENGQTGNRSPRWIDVYVNMVGVAVPVAFVSVHPSALSLAMGLVIGAVAVAVARKHHLFIAVAAISVMPWFCAVGRGDRYSLYLLLIAAGVLAFAAFRARVTWERHAAGALAAFYVVLAPTHYYSAESANSISLNATAGYVSLVVMAAVLGLAVWLRTVGEKTVFIELAAAFAGVAGLFHAGSHETSLPLTVYGAPFFIILLFDPVRRTAYKWTSIFFLGAAWIARMQEADVETLEAYTLPFAILFTGLGVYSMLRDEKASSWTNLAAGVSLLLFPSLMLAMVDPVSIRALYVGCLATVLFAVGVMYKWQSPLVLSSGALGLLGLIELAPYVFVLGPVLPIATFSALFILVGATWEARVNDGRAIMLKLQEMR